MFHKSRSENSNNFMSPHNFDDPIISSTNNECVNITPCGHQNITSLFNHNQSHQHHVGGPNPNPNPNPSTSLGLDFDLSRDHHMNHQPHCSSSHDCTHNKLGDQSTRCEDDYGFLFDFDGSNVVPSSLEDMRFVDDSSLVFI